MAGLNLDLSGKTALVTGSTAGIGRAIAAGLAAQDAHVVINGRSRKRVDEAIAAIRMEQPSANLAGAVADLATVVGAESIVEQFPNIDVLVNNVGIFEPKPFLEISDEDWRLFLDLNFMSGVRLSRAYLPGMIERAWGRIVFISSESGVQIPPEMVHYGVTKAAQIALARGIAEAVAGTGVTVNSVLPGPTRSEGVGAFVAQLAVQQGLSEREMEKQFFETARPSSLIKRFADVGEVANLVVYVCSPAASATTGAALRVDGGIVRGIP
ncbi:MAG: SDR family oxidoreductase [Candidatus Eremiobacteraeota bacterium]|nr:SDR family oxidoreductase [Candidatus Eremiobacteraeota bacterium]